MTKRQGRARSASASPASSTYRLAVLLLLLALYPVPTLAFLEMAQYALTEIINFVKIRTIGPSCKTMPTITIFNFERFIARSWYVQKHQITEQRDYSERFCMVETYNVNETFPGRVQMVKYHTGQGGGGVNNNPYIDNGYCMTQGTLPGQFLILPCNWPLYLTFLGGPWYVVDTDYDNYAIVTAGQLTKRGECDDASGLCTVPNRGELLDPGSWWGKGQGIYFLTRQSSASAQLLADMERKAIGMGICTAAMLPVTQAGCSYEGAGRK